MARLPRAASILRAAEHWRSQCLLRDGSVFTDQELWTHSNAQDLITHYAERLDAGEGNFFEKLSNQVGTAPPDAAKLAAEMFWLLYLIMYPGSMSAATKRSQIRRVWNWSGERFPEEHWTLQEVLGEGIVNTGTAYNTLRWKEFLFLVMLVHEWKSLSSERQHELIGDPWRFAEWLGDVDESSGRQFRHVLLFLLFPDTFEPIASASHKKQLVRRFRQHYDAPEFDTPGNDWVSIDRTILRIRERASADYGAGLQDIDFYEDPLVELWRPRKASAGKAETPEDAAPLLSEQEARAAVTKRFGDVRFWIIAPGEGARLWSEFQREEIAAIGWDDLGDLEEFESRDHMQEEIERVYGRPHPTNDSLAVWQFSREMSPGDIVMAKRGRAQLLGWGVVEGDYRFDETRGEYRNTRSVSWKKVGEWSIPSNRRPAIKTLTDFTPYSEWLYWAFRTMDAEEKVGGPVVTPPPYSAADALEELFLDPREFTDILDTLGRRKNIILQGPPGVGKTFMARRLAYAQIGFKDPDRVQLVQFHQSYAYEDFIQGWRPNAEGGFHLQDGVFHRFCRAAASDPERTWVFIIDEINRGNLSRIFGELMMLIESDKRGQDFAIPLTYSAGDSFHVPENVYLIGLMNTADRSLAMVDYALRRRFGFLDLRPAFSGEKFTAHLVDAGAPEELVEKVTARMGILNREIRGDRKNLGPGFEIGHSYFVPSGGEESLDEAWYETVVRHEIAPLLREYWFDQPGVADAHVARLLE